MTSHPKASKKWISVRTQKLKDRPLYRAIDIRKDILKEHGVRLPYKQAWMGKEVMRVVIHGNKIASYGLLLWHADKIAEMNPSSILKVVNDGGGSNVPLFLSTPMCLALRVGVGHYFFVDGTHLLGKY